MRTRFELRCAALAALAMIAAGTAAETPRFRERSEELGIDFVHRHYGTGEKRMPENMGSGVAVLDVNGDRRLDLYFVQGRPWSGEAGVDDAGNRLFLQTVEGRFVDATADSGAADSAGYGMGVVHGDIDRDGDVDLYLTNFGENRLLLGAGNGRFEAAPKGAHDVPDWSAGAALFDADGDGDLDLWVTNYLDFDPSKSQWCGNAQTKLRSYCHPDVYDGAADRFLENRDGRYVDASERAGVEVSADAKGLGVVSLDLDGDLRPDVYVANDSTMNDLYFGRDGGFEERALLSGAAVNGKGSMEASMGIAAADLDGDARVDLFLTHLDQETNTLYRGLAGGRFRDDTEPSGLGPPSLPWVGFGTTFLDADLDGDLDLFVANGHILDNIEAFDPTRRHRQPPQLFENLGSGRFVERSDWLPDGLAWVGRGVVAADLDRDGDEDLVVTQNDGPARVLVNETLPASSALSLGVRLTARKSAPGGVGARIELVAEAGSRNRWVVGGGSYLSQGPGEVYFALDGGRGDEAAVSIVVHWPNGRTDRFDGLVAGALYDLEEGGEVLHREPFRKASEDGASRPAAEVSE